MIVLLFALLLVALYMYGEKKSSRCPSKPEVKYFDLVMDNQEGIFDSLFQSNLGNERYS